jgi:mono/diheme cytochrome c family protein
MKRFGRWIKKIFLPPQDASTAVRLLPYGIVVILIIGVILFATGSWEYTNTTEFCGTACHTMPPQYVTHQLSDHARVTCEDCHLGRAELATQIVRKIQYSWQTGSAMVTNSYEYPIIARNMRPANEVCETCHYPQVFSNDRLIELERYKLDENNTLNTTYLIMKTGGGSEREGLGFGIHWHIENPVYFYATDEERQEIPYVVVENDDGSKTEYIDSESGFNPAMISTEDLEPMDCITCHNRTAHGITNPDDKIDELMSRGEISADIPYIRNQASLVLRSNYEDQESARLGIEKLLDNYERDYPLAYQKYKTELEDTVEKLWAYYENAVFFDQEMKWDTHPDNAQHLDSPGCFRCHDGKHLTETNEAVRLECNICHSIPVVSGPNEFVTDIEVSKGIEPENHKNSNWIGLHREYFDDTCANCHTVEDPGGASNTSFCSNSGCHGQSWEYAGFNAPKLRELLEEMVKVQPTQQPEETLQPGETPTYESIAGLFDQCTVCHGDDSLKGVNLSSYETIMAGADGGPLVVPGDAENSLIVTAQSQDQAHFGQFTPQELERIIEWINAGAE